MDESEGPYFYNCPKRIMDIIERSKPVNDMSKEWRMKVHKVLDTKLTKGKVITFKKPIDFGEFSENTFRYLGNNKFRSMNHGGVYTIPKWLVVSLM